MLDYTANGARHWAEDTLQVLFEGTRATVGRGPGVVLEEVIGPAADRAL